MRRKIIQICSTHSLSIEVKLLRKAPLRWSWKQYLFALADDGTLWEQVEKDVWEQRYVLPGQSFGEK